MSSEDGNPEEGKDADAPKDMPYTAGDSTASSAELVEVTPECLAEDETRLQSYRSYLQKAGESYAMDQAAMARERRWTIAEEKLNGALMVSPNGAFRTRWDMIQVLLLLYVAIFVPYRIGFEQDTAPGDFFWMVDVCVDLYFLIDIGMSFRTGFVDGRGELQWKPGVLAGNYFTGWFVIDVSSCLPVNYVGLLPGVEINPQNARSNKMLRLLRLLRLLKLLRLMRINRILGRFSLSDGFEAEYHAILTGMKLMKLVFIILGLAHWLGCAWYYCGDVRKEETVEFHDDGTPIVGWVHYVGKEQFSLPKEADYYTRYMSSLYWSIMTMTTVGYGNISASTYSELLCSIVGMMGGGFAFGAIVGNLSEFSRRSNPGKNLESKRTGMLRAFLVERGANARLTKRISLWYMGHLGFHTPMESESMLLNMPAQLRDELMVELGYATGKSKSDSVQYSIVHRVPFLSTLDNVSLIMISLRLNFERFAWSDINLEDENQSVRDNELMSAGAPAEWLTIIVDGRCRIIEGDMELGDCQDGDFFGEVSLLRPAEDIRAGLPAPLFRRTALALTDCSMHTLSAFAFAELSERRPAIRRMAAPYIARIAPPAEDERDGDASSTPIADVKKLSEDVTTMQFQVEDVTSRLDSLEQQLSAQHNSTVELLQGLLQQTAPSTALGALESSEDGDDNTPSNSGIGVAFSNPMHTLTSSQDD